MFRGYAGWASGQLDSELAAGAWMVFDALRDDVFHQDPDDLWRLVLRRQTRPGRLAGQRPRRSVDELTMLPAVPTRLRWRVRSTVGGC